MTAHLYNGFSPAERRESHNALKKALASGIVQLATICSVCWVRPEKALGWHAENYNRPLEAYPVCWRCHYAIHIRFRRPAYWQAYISRLDPAGWFQGLSLDPATLTRPFDVTYPDGLPRASQPE